MMKIALGNVDPLTGVEVGVAVGIHAKELLDELPHLILHLVDNYSEGFKKERIGELVKDHPRVVFHLTDSISASQQFKDEELDFVYIDASHFYPTVRDDLNAWGPKVKYGGIICGHDFHVVWEPHHVALAVIEFSTMNGLKLNNDPDLGRSDTSDWWIFK